jgi:hypothetical protein
MRRVVVTPTFAAGLGVVVAAVLAYPMQTVFNYAGPAEVPCQPAPAPCGLSNGMKAPQLGSGNRMKTPSATAPHSGRSTSGRPGSQGTDGRGHADPPRLTYHTYSKGQWGFAGTIEITFEAKHANDRWRLRFGYPSARILKVWAGKLLPHGAHSGRAKPFPTAWCGSRSGSPGTPGRRTGVLSTDGPAASLSARGLRACLRAGPAVALGAAPGTGSRAAPAISTRAAGTRAAPGSTRAVPRGKSRRA